MSGAGIAQIVLYWVVLIALAVPLGRYMARVYEGEARWAQKVLGPLERALYRLFGVDPKSEQSWQRYAVAVMVFNLLGVLVVYALQRLQAHLPGNPNDLASVDPRVAWNTAISFASNTNWQTYGGETTMSNLVQALALGVQNFVSAATGMAVLVALVRGFTRKQAAEIGNFWVDLTRSTVYVLVPLSIALAVLLVQQGVPQTMDGRTATALVQATSDADGHAVVEQGIAVGPVASQVAIKQLGTNGGGFYNVNSAHPLENPTPLTNFFQCLAILLIAAATCFMFGELVGRRRQGVALLVAMVVLVAPFLVLAEWQEHQPNPAFADLPVDQSAGNLEGKEVRYGPGASALWAVATTAASNGSVNAMHDSFTPLGGLAPMVLMQLGEVAFGGVGSGLYGLLMFAIVAVFIAGLMVGRTPELLGKKIEAYEMKMASIAILVPCAAVLAGTALACLVPETVGTADVPGVLGNPGPHGFSEILYAFSSMGNNNGSAFAGLTASKTFFATAGGIAMFAARYWIIIPVLAIAGSLARKRSVPVTAGTLPTDGPLFVLLLVGTVLLVGALTFVPALALGPIAEALGGLR